MRNWIFVRSIFIILRIDELDEFEIFVCISGEDEEFGHG